MEMKAVLQNVLIKEIDGDDKVFYIDNLPKSFLYHRVTKRVIDPENQDRMIPEFAYNEHGKRYFTGATEDALLPGIKRSKNGDEGYCFFMQYNEAQMRLKDIDNYVKSMLPVAERIPMRVPYALQPGLKTSGPKPLHTLPRVVLPEPASPPSKDEQVSAPTAVSAQVNGVSPVTEVSRVKKTRKPMTEEQKIAARERLAKAREAKKAKVS